MKKFISLLMAAAMVVTMVPATAFAANANTSLVGGVKVVSADDADTTTRITANEIRVKVDSDSTLKVGDTATFTFTVDNAVFATGKSEGDVIDNKDGSAASRVAVIFKDYDKNGGLNVINNGSTVAKAKVTEIKWVDCDDDTQTIEVKVADLATGDTVVFRPNAILTKTSKNTKVTLDVSVDKNISEDFSTTIITVDETDLTVSASSVEQSEEKANDGEALGLGKITINDTIDKTLIANGNKVKITLKGDYEWKTDVCEAASISGVSNITVGDDEDGDAKILYLELDGSEDKITIYKDTLEVVAIDDVSAGDSVKATFEMTDKVDDLDNEKTSNKVSNIKLVDVVEEEGITIALDDEDEDMVVAWSGKTDDGDAWQALSVLVDGLDSEAFNEKRDVVVTFPEGVFLTDAEFDNSVFSVKKYDMDKNELTLDVNATNAADEGEEVVTFHFVTESTFDGDVEATFGGSALDDEYSIVIAQSKPIATLDVASVKIESGYKSTEIPGTATFTEAEADLFDKGDEFKFVVPQGKTNSSTNLTAFEVELAAEADADSDAEVEVQKDDCTVEVKSVSDEKAMVVTLSDMVVYVPTTTALGSYKLRAMAEEVFDADDFTVDAGALASYYANTAKGDYKANAVGLKADEEDVDFDQFIESATNFVEVVAAGMVSETNTSAFTSVVDVTIGSNQIVVDGTPVTVDAPAYINKDNRTMVPLRAVAVALGVSDDQIVWVASERTVIVNYADTWISMVIGSQIMKVNGIEMAMTTAPEISNSRTFLPMADLGRALGVTATWDAATKTASFNK